MTQETHPSKMLKVEAVTIKDIKGNDLKYVRISNGDVSYAISVGQKTFDSVKELITPTAQKLPLPETETKKPKP